MALRRCATLVPSLPFPHFTQLKHGTGIRLFLLVFLLGGADSFATDSVFTLQSFGIRVRKGQPVYPLPSNVALGLFNSDPLLDVAYCADGNLHVYQNLGNGTFAPVWEKRATGNVGKLEWRTTGNLKASIGDPSNWGELVIHYADGRSELISHTQMFGRENNLPVGGFTALPPPDPPLSFHEVWRSEPNPGLAVEVGVGDMDNDGKEELMYLFNAAPGDSTRRLVVYECVGNDSFIVDWDTVMYTTDGGPLAITDIDNDGHKEIVTAYFPRGVGVLPSMAFIECLGPRRYRYYYTNIGFQRPLFTARETDINHNGVKELTVLTSDPNGTVDPTLIYVAEFAGKSILPNGTGMMTFNQQLARYQGYVFDMAVGQVDGQGWDEIIPAGGSFGYNEPVPVDYLWHSGLPAPNEWLTRGIYTGLQSGTGAVMFVNLDADTAMEFVSGAPGPVGHGSMFALKYQHDTTWSVMWADSSLRNSPLWVNSGWLNGQFVVAGANTWDLSPLDTFYTNLNVYEPQGFRTGIWRRDSIYIQQFHLADIDHDGRTNLIFAQTSNRLGRYAIDFETDSLTYVGSDSDLLPHQYQLFQNYPNPFNPRTTITFMVARSENVRLGVYNVLGQEVALLVNEKRTPGKYKVQWDASCFASGAYLYQLRLEGHTITRKMLLVR